MIALPGGIGGAERIAGALVRAGLDRGWPQLVLNPFAGEATATEHPLFTGAEYRSHRVCSRAHLTRVRNWTRRELEAFSPTLTHVHLFPTAVVVATLPRSTTGIRVLTHHHGELFHVQRRPLRILLDAWSGRRFDSVVAVSRSVESFLTTRYRYPREKVTTIRNGWEGHPLEPADRGSHPIIVSIANLRPEKDHAGLIAAFAGVVEDFPEARLWLIGSGGLRDELESHVADRGLPEHVEFIGDVDDVWRYLARADVFVLSSRSEALGLGALEAMAAGLPVVATSVGGVPEIVVDDETGRLVPPGDTSALANALKELLADPALRRRFGVAGRSVAEQMTIDTMVKRYFDHYAALLGAAHG